MANDDPLALVGTTVSSKYAIERVVGEGASAVVYRAMHLVFKRPVAIKVFHGAATLSVGERARLLEAFVQEGALLSDLSERSAAICQARDVGSLTTPAGQPLPFMVLEWLEGTPLDAFLAEQPADAPHTLDEWLKLFDPIAEALALAHRKGIAHRDLKPANLFVIDGGGKRALKLLDFGIAKVLHEAQRQMLEKTGADKSGGAPLTFTPSYGAPEQFSRAYGPTGPWTDVFALALILSEVLSGKPALPRDATAMTAAIDKQARPTPRALGASIADEIEAVFRKALAVSPQERYQTVGELWNELRGAIFGESVPSIKRAPTLRLHASRRNSRGIPQRNPAPADLLPPSSLPPPEIRTLPSERPPTGRRSRPAPEPSAPPLAASDDAPASPSGRHSMLVLGGLSVAAFVTVIAGFAGFTALRAKRGEPVANAASAPSPSPAPPAAPDPKCPDGMVKIPAGSFFMGSDEKGDLDVEKPAHKVALTKPFCMDVHEVTTAAYKAASDAGLVPRAGHTNDWEGITAVERKAYDPLCNARAPEERGKHPINCLSWDLADAYCKAQKKRLPTEAEWEYAARGPDGRKYPWGDEAPNATLLNACGRECITWGKKNHVDPTGVGAGMYSDDDGFPTTAPVGSFPAGKSRYGVEDVVGNVWEWVADWYAPYAAGDQTDPGGPPAGRDRVIRGGAWNGANPAWVHPTFRYHDTPTKRSHGIGFRCAGPLAASSR